MISVNSKTLGDLRDEVKRRILQLAADASTTTDVETPTFLNESIYDAINAARAKVARVVASARKWVTREKSVLTDSDVQEYVLDLEVQRITAVWYDTAADGKRNANTKYAHDVLTAETEDLKIADPFDTPSADNPMYRITNRGLRLITSEDGSVVADKYVTVEYIGEPDLLTNPAQNTAWPDTLNAMVVDVAIGILCAETLPELAQMAMASFGQSLMGE